MTPGKYTMGGRYVAIWRSPDLEAAIGGPMDEAGLTEGALTRLIHHGVREGEQLEFKGKSYGVSDPPPGRGWSWKQEFAKDVVALANHRGGLLLIGVDATDGVATSLQPIVGTTPEDEEQRLRTALVNHVAPILSLSFVSIAAESGGFFLAAIVPPSRQAPHAVLGDPGDGRRPLRYPRRHGSDTFWLTESEVAQRYRQRAEAEKDVRARVDFVVNDGCLTLARGGGLWFFAALIPEMTLATSLDAVLGRDIAAWYSVNRATSPLGRKLTMSAPPLAAPGRLTFTGFGQQEADNDGSPHGAYLELHVSGAAFAAISLEGEGPPDSQSGDLLVGERTLVDDAILLGESCFPWSVRQVGAWGTATAVLGFFDPHRAPAGLSRPVCLRERADFGELRRMSQTRRLLEAPRVLSGADLGQLSDPVGRLAAVAQLLAGLMQWFGKSESSLVTTNGEIISSGWHGAGERNVREWAGVRGISYL